MRGETVSSNAARGLSFINCFSNGRRACASATPCGINAVRSAADALRKCSVQSRNAASGSVFGGSVNGLGAAVVTACGAAVVALLAINGATDVPAFVLEEAEAFDVGFAMLRPERWSTNRQVQSRAIPVTRSMG